MAGGGERSKEIRKGRPEEVKEEAEVVLTSPWPVECSVEMPWRFTITHVGGLAAAAGESSSEDFVG